MKRLRTTLQSEASKYIHLAIVLSLYIGSERSLFLLLLFFIELLYLAKRERRFLLIVLIFILSYQIRVSLIHPLVADVDDTQFTAKITGIRTNGLIVDVNGAKVMIYASGLEEIYPGDIVKVKGSFFESEIHQIDHVFDYQDYLLSMDVTSQFYANEINIIGHDFDIREIEYRLLNHMKDDFSEVQFAYLSMFVFGNDDAMDTNTVELFREIGIAHLFAISGMHVGMLIMALEWILSHFFIREKTKYSIVFGFLFFYNILTGFLISIVRASIQTVIVVINKNQKWFFSKTDLLSFSYIAFLFYRPYLLFQSGFQLSYFIAFAIILGQDLFKDAKPFYKMVLVNCLASAFSLPILLEMNECWGAISPVSSLFFLMLVSYVFLPLSIMTVMIPQVSGLYGFMISGFEKLLHLFSAINPKINFNFPSIIMVFSFYFGLFLFIKALILKKKRMLSFTILFYSILFSILAAMNPFVSKVVFLDVGQGDSTYIQSGSCRILIDTGPSDEFDSVISYLHGENVYRLDALVLTHFHSDHYGEAIDILNTMQVDHLYANKSNELFPTIEVLSVNDQFSCGNLEFEVLHANTSNANENNNSLVLYTKILEDDYLFLGDIEESEELNLISSENQSIDVMKVAHHGSETSTSIFFLDVFQPDIAIVSVGKNDYGHPSQSVLDRLNEKKIMTYRTDDSGTVTITYYFGIQFRLIRFNQYRFKLLGG